MGEEGILYFAANRHLDPMSVGKAMVVKGFHH